MNGLEAIKAHDITCRPDEKWMSGKKSGDNNLVKRLSNYLINSIKVAILGFLWFILFQVPWESLPDAPLGGKIIVALVLWSVWSFMVMVVSGELDKKDSNKR